jgi:hypothetical protein
MQHKALESLMRIATLKQLSKHSQEVINLETNIKRKKKLLAG